MPVKAKIQKPHITSDKGGVSRIVKENPLLRMSSKDQGTILVQGGQVMFENGTIIEKPPQWFIDAYSALSEAQQEAYGVDADDLTSPPVPAPKGK